MFKKSFQILLICILALGFCKISIAQIYIKVKMPPPNQLGAGDLWNLTLDNTSGKDMNVYLNGSLSEEKDGLIVEGKSKVFTVKPGKKDYKYDDFKSAEIKYSNGKYKEVFIRTGNAPEGDYTICVTAFSEQGDVVGQETCINQPVKPTGIISLTSPEDGAEFRMGGGVDEEQMEWLFSWTPLPKANNYNIKIVEMRGDQSPEAAIKQNRPFFEKKDIRTINFQYPISEKKFEAGNKYAWQVSSGSVESEVFEFKVALLNYYANLEFTPEPCPPSCNYKLSVSGNNPIPFNGFKVTINTTYNHIASLTLMPGYTAITSNSSTVAVKKNSGTFQPGAEIGTINFLQADNPFPVEIYWTTNYGEPYVLPPDHKTLQCPCPPCECPENTHFAPLTITIGSNPSVTIDCGGTLTEPILAGTTVTINTSYACPEGCPSPPLYFTGVRNIVTPSWAYGGWYNLSNFPITFNAPSEGTYAFCLGVHCYYNTGQCDTCTFSFNTTQNTLDTCRIWGYKYLDLNDNGSMDVWEGRSGWKIELFNAGVATGMFAVTNWEGYFEILNVPCISGPYSLREEPDEFQQLNFTAIDPPLTTGHTIVNPSTGPWYFRNDSIKTSDTCDCENISKPRIQIAIPNGDPVTVEEDHSGTIYVQNIPFTTDVTFMPSIDYPDPPFYICDPPTYLPVYEWILQDPSGNTVSSGTTTNNPIPVSFLNDGQHNLIYKITCCGNICLQDNVPLNIIQNHNRCDCQWPSIMRSPIIISDVGSFECSSTYGYGSNTINNKTISINSNYFGCDGPPSLCPKSYRFEIIKLNLAYQEIEVLSSGEGRIISNYNFTGTGHTRFKVKFYGYCNGRFCRSCEIILKKAGGIEG